VQITVQNVNRSPVAVDDAADTLEDAAVTIDVLANDGDVDGDALVVASVTQGANGTVTNNGSSVTYTPDAGFLGTDTFTYTASDGTAQSSSATVTVTVSDVPDTGTLIITCDNGYTLYMNGAEIGTGSNWMQSQTYTIDVADGKNVVAVRGADAGGVAGLLAELIVAGQRSGTSTDWKVSLTEEQGWQEVSFDDSAWARATDYGAYGVGPWGTRVAGMPADTPARWIWSSNNDADNVVYARFTFGEDGGNTPPVAEDQSVTMDEDAAAAITLAATDPDGDALTYRIVSEPGCGMLTGTPPNVTYEPDGDYHGQDSFTFVANDGYGDGNTATVTITVASVNDAPVAADGGAATTVDSPVGVVLDAYDVDGDAISFAVASPPADGVITGDDGDEQVTYTPNAGFSGLDSFTFVASDGIAESAPATVTISVTADLVSIVSVSTGAQYSLATAEVGALYYIDRKYTITSLASELDGMVLVRTANNDKRVTESDHLVLRLGTEAVVSVCYDKRWSVLPSWLDDGTWTYAGGNVAVADGPASPLEVFEKTFPAGELTLGGNLAGGASGAKSNYVVVVRPVGTEFNSVLNFKVGPLAADEWLNDGDSDGDGLLDSFEIEQGLDPDNADTDADGIADEAETDVDGTDLWDVQENLVSDEPDDTPAGGGSGGGCFIGTASLK